MKKIILLILAGVAAVGLVALFIYRQQAGYTKVLTAKVARQDLVTVVSGTGQIKPERMPIWALLPSAASPTSL